MNHKRLLALAAVAGLALAACSDDDDTSSTTTAAGSPTSAAGGTGLRLDDSFGEGGLLSTPLSATDDDRFISVAVGPEGRYYAAGFVADGDDHAFAVARFDAEGALDDTFGAGGLAVINVAEGGGGAEVGRGLVVHEDGSVVVAGPFEADPGASGAAARDLDVAVIRLTPDGELDSTFGDGGVAKLDFGSGKEIHAESYLTDNAWGLTAREGGYAVFGATPNQDEGRKDVDFVVAGVTEDGQLDEGFGEAGVVVVDIDETVDNPRNIVAQDDGKLLATGYSRNGEGVVFPVLIRLDATGKLDESFGDGGVANHVVLPGVAESYQVVPQGDGYVMAGYGRGASSDEKVDMVIFRFRADGSHDTSFGTDGVTRIDLVGQDDRGRNLTVLPDGNILVVGSGKLDANNVDAMIVLLDPNGSPVDSFGEDGHLLLDLGGPGDAFFGVDVAEDGSVIVAGFLGAAPEGDGHDEAVLARLVA